jgi:hypothetical protein
LVLEGLGLDGLNAHDCNGMWVDEREGEWEWSGEEVKKCEEV